ncbi:hypothetical protein [Desulfocicer vacuolatum]|nr:hypothetical protein [Desulfocicer vacuolatum]
MNKIQQIKEVLDLYKLPRAVLILIRFCPQQRQKSSTSLRSISYKKKYKVAGQNVATVPMNPGLKIELKRLDIIWGRDYTHGVGKMQEVTGTDMSRGIYT